LFLHKTFKALNGLLCADVPLRNYSLTHSQGVAAYGENNEPDTASLDKRRQNWKVAGVKLQCLRPS